MLPALHGSASRKSHAASASPLASRPASHMLSSGTRTADAQIHPGPFSAHNPKRPRWPAAPTEPSVHAQPVEGPLVGNSPAGPRSTPVPSAVGRPGCNIAASVGRQPDEERASEPHSAVPACWCPVPVACQGFWHRRPSVARWKWGLGYLLSASGVLVAALAVWPALALLPDQRSSCRRRLVRLPLLRRSQRKAPLPRRRVSQALGQCQLLHSSVEPHMLPQHLHKPLVVVRPQGWVPTRYMKPLPVALPMSR
mmetsp:Transcript_118221/g.229887  ORF Transcript_118221/g.229887 Transcript_118221/m.229887 type:complete len:253 (-) Transcript_118221:392-1150(-)